MDVAVRDDILNRYRDHAREFDVIASHREHRLGRLPQPAYALLAELPQKPTTREAEILKLVSSGLGNREIGQRLLISEETVKTLVRRLLLRLPARNRAHAVAVGFRRDLLA